MAAETATKADQENEVLIEQGIFRLDERGQPRLIGSRCPACKSVFGGRRRVCLACFGRDLQEHLLGPQGVIHSYTTVHQAGRGSFVQAPYNIVQVRLPEGVIVTAPLVDCDPSGVSMDLPVETKALRFPNESGQTIVTFAFVPSRKGAKESQS